MLDRTRRNARTLATVTLAVLTFAACTQSSSTKATSSPASPAAPVSTTASPEPTTDEVTPLIVDTLGDPIPVKGTDDKYHNAYELRILNYAAREATLRSVESIDPATNEVVTKMDHDAIVASSILVGNLPATPKPAETIPPGGTIVLLMDDVYTSPTDIPAQVVHKMSATFAKPAPDQGPFAADIYPAKVTQMTGATNTGTGKPLVIGPPLDGDNWLAVNACCTLTPHRGAMLSMNGRINATERYAVDWIRIDTHRFAETIKKGLLPDFKGDPTDNESYFGFNAYLLAVADGTVVKAIDDRPDIAPQGLPEGLTLDEFGGNYLILDLGDGYYAFYAHIKEGSIAVDVGDHVFKGQAIAHLGNSGNTSEAHLHFHVMRGPVPLGATNWPFVIDNFDVVGSLSDTGFVPQPSPGPRTDEMVMVRNITNFPGNT